MSEIERFLAGIGVATHVDATATPYGNVALVRASLAYLGVALIRDHAYDIDLAAYQTLAAAGVKFDLILDDDPRAEIDSLLPVAAAIRYFEGPNESDYQPILTNGIADPVLAAVTEQQSVLAAVRATPAVSGIPVIAESMADPANLAVFAGNLAFADIANLHAYAAQGASPRTVLAADLALAQALSAKPVAVTETGYTTLLTDDGGVNESVQARLTLDTLFDAASLGLYPTFLYELFDEAPDPAGANSELHYGLFNTDGSPKQAATAVHNLTSILASANAAPGTAPALAVSTANLPDTGHTLTLAGAAGTAVIAVWAEPPIWDNATHSQLAAPIVQTTVDFGVTAGSVTVFDPLSGTAPIASYTGVSNITVALTDHPLLIELSAPTPVTPTPGSPTPVTPTPVTPSAPTPGPATGSGSPPGAATGATVTVYRFFDTSNGTHFYTASAAEAAAVRQTRPDLAPEGAGLRAIDPAAADPVAAAVYRFFDRATGTHFFTASPAERDATIATRPDLTYEPDSVFYEHLQPQPGDTPVYRFFDTAHGTHFYTGSESERALILASRSDLVAEGIGFYEPG